MQFFLHCTFFKIKHIEWNYLRWGNIWLIHTLPTCRVWTMYWHTELRTWGCSSLCRVLSKCAQSSGLDLWHHINLVWSCTPVISSKGRGRQENRESRTILSTTVSSKLVRDTADMSQTNKQNYNKCKKNWSRLRVSKLLTQAGISHPIKEEVSVPGGHRHAQSSFVSKSDRHEARGDFIFSEEPAPPCGLVQTNSDGVPREQSTLFTDSIVSLPFQYGN